MRMCTLTAAGKESVRTYLNHPVEGFPPLFYAVATNDER